MKWYLQCRRTTARLGPTQRGPGRRRFNGSRASCSPGVAQRQVFVRRADGKPGVDRHVFTNWSKGFDERGQPIPDPAKDPQIDGSLVTPNQGGATNWPPPTFSPKTGLFYVSAAQAYSVWYIYDAGDNPQGWGGTDRGGWQQNMLQAIDYKTGKVRWSHKWEGGCRASEPRRATSSSRATVSSGNFVALNARRENRCGMPAFAPGDQRARSPTRWTGGSTSCVGAGDTLWAFVRMSNAARRRR